MLYNLCEWPSRKGSRLAVIGIANTLDLPERLMPRIASRLGSRRVVFQPYKREQLQAIVSQRLIDAGVAEAFEGNAIKYAASKVGNSAPFLLGQCWYRLVFQGLNTCTPYAKGRRIGACLNVSCRKLANTATDSA